MKKIKHLLVLLGVLVAVPQIVSNISATHKLVLNYNKKFRQKTRY
jgi:hypothetical protein